MPPSCRCAWAASAVRPERRTRPPAAKLEAGLRDRRLRLLRPGGGRSHLRLRVRGEGRHSYCRGLRRRRVPRSGHRDAGGRGRARRARLHAPDARGDARAPLLDGRLRPAVDRAVRVRTDPRPRGGRHRRPARRPRRFPRREVLPQPGREGRAVVRGALGRVPDRDRHGGRGPGRPLHGRLRAPWRRGGGGGTAPSARSAPSSASRPRCAWSRYGTLDRFAFKAQCIVRLWEGVRVVPSRDRQPVDRVARFLALEARHPDGGPRDVLPSEHLVGDRTHVVGVADVLVEADDLDQLARQRRDRLERGADVSGGLEAPNAQPRSPISASARNWPSIPKR